MSDRIKIAVTGGAGQIGYALLFRLVSGQAFGPNTRVDLNLIEIEKALPALEGVVMELQDCAFPLLGEIKITSDLKEGMKDVNWVVLVGAAPRKEGMERSDLLKVNGGIFKPQGCAINEYASSDVKVLVVGNPCNTNALIAMNNAPDVPKERFFAMTMLDQNRACAQLAMKANVPVAEVENVIIWGNHSSTQYPDFYNASIKGKKAVQVIQDENWLKDKFIPLVQQRGAAVIKARGSSSAASAANAIIDCLYNLSHDTAAGKSYSMCCHSQGEYGVDEGLIFSFPCQTKGNKVIVDENFKHNTFGQEKLKATLNELCSERDAVKKLGLI